MSEEIKPITTRLAATQASLLEYLRQKSPNLNDSQVKEFLTIAGTYKLDPWKREIYAVTYETKRKVPDNRGGFTEVTETQMSVITGYEVFLKIADSFPQYDGYGLSHEGTFKKTTITKEYPSRYNGGTYKKTTTALVPAGDDYVVTCTVYRTDRSHPTVAEVSWQEFAQENAMWQQKPRIMLEKVAIARAHRLAFPNEFGGMPYISEELPERMQRQDTRQDTSQNASTNRRNFEQMSTEQKGGLYTLARPPRNPMDSEGLFDGNPF